MLVVESLFTKCRAYSDRFHRSINTYTGEYLCGAHVGWVISESVCIIIKSHVSGKTLVSHGKTLVKTRQSNVL